MRKLFYSIGTLGLLGLSLGLGACKNRYIELEGQIRNAPVIAHAVQSGDNLTCYRKFEGLPAVVRDAYESRVIHDPYNNRQRVVGVQGFGSRPLVPDPNTLYVGTTINLPDVDGKNGVGCQK